MKNSIIIIILVVINITVSRSYDEKSYYVWGRNIDRQLGVINNSSLTQIGNDNDWVDASMSKSISVAVKKDGTLWKWGVDNLKDISLVPKQLSKEPRYWERVWAFEGGFFALKRNSSLWQYGAFEGMEEDIKNKELQQAGFDFGYKELFIVINRVYALKNDSSLWTWGDDNFGQYGKKFIKNPVQILPGSKWKYVTGNYFYTLGIMTDGTLWIWGSKPYFDVVDQNQKYFTEKPIQIGIDSDWVKIVCLSKAVVGLKENGELWAFHGEDGSSSKERATDFDQPLNRLDSNIIDFYFKFGRIAIIRNDSTLWISTFNGIVNNYPPTFKYSPEFFTDNIRKIILQLTQIFILKNDGTLWTEGINCDLNAGILNRVIPEPQKNGFNSRDWKKFVSGLRIGAGIKSDSTLWLWGTHFQLDTNILSSERHLPVKYKSDSEQDEKWIDVYIGRNLMESCFLAKKSDSTIWGWMSYRDYKNIGKLQLINSEKNWKKIIPSDEMSYLVITNEDILLQIKFTLNNDGSITYISNRIGKNKYFSTADVTKSIAFTIDTDKYISKYVISPSDNSMKLSLKSFKKVTVDGAKMYALDTENNLWSMNVNESNIRMIKVGQKWIDIASGYNHTLAIRDDYTLWAAGYNNCFQLGNNSLDNSDTLILIDSSRIWYDIGANYCSSYGLAEELIGGITDPVLISPENNSFLCGLNAIFSWKKAKNTVGYILEVSNDMSFSNMVDVYFLKDTSFICNNFIDNSTYYWRLTAVHDDGFKKRSKIWKFQTKSTSSVLESKSGIHPNPATEYITIQFQPSEGLEPSEGYRVQIFDMLGLEVAQTPSSVNNMKNTQTGASELLRIDVSHLLEGVYFIKINYSNGACSIVEKFVKM